MSGKFKHPLITECAANPAAVIRRMSSVLELAEATGEDFSAAQFSSDPRRAGLVYAAIQPGGLFGQHVGEMVDVRALMMAGQVTLRQLIKRNELTVGVVAGLDAWRGRAVAAEAEVARLRSVVEMAGLDAEVGEVP